MAVHTLRDTLLSSLSSLPGTRHFHIHVLVSSPRKHASLFPYAHPRPRVYLQDVVVLLSEQSAPGASRAFVTAIEAQVYNLPATSCGVLYIQKVDATGQGSYPSPASTLVRSFVAYYADPATRPISVDTFWIQLFARAQGQYLFPNSSDFPGKKPLSDVKLCAWWKRIFSEVAVGVESRLWSGRKNGSSEEDGDGRRARMKLFYLLPGYSELEAQHSLKLNSQAQSGLSSQPVSWTYGHQYSQTDIPLPCPPGPEETHLGYIIPWFDDDPKSRFIDDLAHNTETNAVKSPKKKKPKISLGSSQKPDSTASTSDVPTRKAEREPAEDDRRTPTGELDKVTPDEFWERMSFRQECVSGAITGFFALGISTTAQAASTSKNTSGPSPLAPQAGQVSARLVRRVVSSLMTAHEFSTVEQAIKATETLEESIKGLCDGIATVPVASKTNVSSSARLLLLKDEDSKASDSTTADNATPDSTNTPSEPRDDEEPPVSTFLDVPRTPPRRTGVLPEISPNPFPEPIASLDTYHAHIYGSVVVSNPALPPKAVDAGKAEERPVTILTVRKKKRKPEA